jgi:hypothetical protein
MKKTPLSRAFSAMKNKNNLPLTAKVLTLKLFLKKSKRLLIFCHSETIFLKTPLFRLILLKKAMSPNKNNQFLAA